MRNAFSMLTAIVIIVLMATVAAFIMNLSGKMVKSTTVQFQREQAVLLAKSYTEYAIMAVTANEHNSTNCLNTITGSHGNYNVQVDISYIGNNLDASCTRVFNRDYTVETIDTPKSQLNIILDVSVDYPDIDNPNNVNMTYHRRSLQKI